MNDLLVAIILGVVEGVTEFLPVSSTGHLLLVQRWIGVNLEDGFWNMFTVFIQIGAIAAVVVYFRKRILSLLTGRSERVLTPLEISASARSAAAASAAHAAGNPAPAHDPDLVSDDTPVTAAQRGYAVLMIILASTPLAIAFVADKWAEKNMQNPLMVPLALIVGGLLMIVIEWLPLNVTTGRIERITWKQALGIGFAQVLAALFPGTSRSAATIMAGLVAGLSRPAAAEFSFFLAIPAMGAACAYKLLKFLRDGAPTASQTLLLVIGTLVSFLVAWVVIAAFMGYIRRHSFVPFAVYRIVLGIIVLLLVRGG
jgi:undecaprenyl-diphosphatase